MKYVLCVVASALVFTSIAASAGKDIVSQGIWCRMVKGSMICVKENGKGYGIGFNRKFVLVTSNHGNHIVFMRRQP